MGEEAGMPMVVIWASDPSSAWNPSVYYSDILGLSGYLYRCPHSGEWPRLRAEGLGVLYEQFGGKTGE